MTDGLESIAGLLLGMQTVLDEIRGRLTDIELALRVAPTGGREQEVYSANAEDIARQLGYSARWVRQHAIVLGGVRLGTGPKAPHRFCPAVVAERLRAMTPQLPELASTVERHADNSRPCRAASGASELLPIKLPVRA